MRPIMIGETKAATDGAGSAEWRAAADCRVPSAEGWWTWLAGVRHLDRGPGCQVARRRSSSHLLDWYWSWSSYSRVTGTSVSALIFPHSTWDQKLTENLATAKQEGKWSDYSVVGGREGWDSPVEPRQVSSAAARGRGQGQHLIAHWDARPSGEPSLPPSQQTSGHRTRAQHSHFTIISSDILLRYRRQHTTQPLNEIKLYQHIINISIPDWIVPSKL